MEIDPKDKLHMDLLLQEKQQKSNFRSWLKWILIFILSQLALYLFNHDIVTGMAGKALGIMGIVGVIGFLVFLSTKAFGHSDTSLWWRIWF